MSTHAPGLALDSGEFVPAAELNALRLHKLQLTPPRPAALDLAEKLEDGVATESTRDAAARELCVLLEINADLRSALKKMVQTHANLRDKFGQPVSVAELDSVLILQR